MYKTMYKSIKKNVFNPFDREVKNERENHRYRLLPGNC